MSPRSGGLRRDVVRPRARRGNYSVLMGSLLFVVIGFAALGVDISLITMAELQAQATADAASHAALVVFRQGLSTVDGNAAADFVLDQNKVALGTALIEPGYPQYGTFDFDVHAFTAGLSPTGNANAVRVKVSRTGANAVDLLLAPILGYDTYGVDGEAITAQQLRAIMLIQDMSCSMMSWGEDSAVNLSRLANLGFLDYMHENPQEGDLLGLAMFAQLGTDEPTNDVPWAHGTNTPSKPPWAPLMDVSDQYGLLTTRFNGICHTSDGQPCSLTGAYHPKQSRIGSCTNPAIAIEQAAYQLVHETDDSYFRGIVFMSDGLPNCDASGYWDGSADDRAQDAADTAWAHGIHIWTIVFHNGSFDTTFMENLVRGIGFSQVSPDAEDLPAMYQTVAKSLPLALVQ